MNDRIRTSSGRQRQSNDAPDSGLEYRQRIVSPQTDDDFLSENNLGLGVYGSQEYWQQVENFSQLIYAEAAFQDYLFWLAESVTRRRVSKHGFSYSYVGPNGDPKEDDLEPWDDLENDEKRDLGRLPDYAKELLSKATEAQAELIDTTERLIDARYDEMPTRAKLQAIRQFTAYDVSKRVPQGRIIMGRHEMSRSKEGRLIDAATTDSKEIVRDERPQGPVNS